MMAGIIDKDLNYCLFGINRKWNKNSFPGCLQCLTVERLEKNVGFGMQISFPLLSLKTKHCVSRRSKWQSICTCFLTLSDLGATLPVGKCVRSLLCFL